eukprot:XP_001692356.1 predicted protein [Chlamydomonas reinhardtii]
MSSLFSASAPSPIHAGPPAPAAVLVRVLVAGVNGGCETFRARGEFAFAGNRELQGFALGAEGAGRIVALGPGVKGLQVGQLVALNGAAAFAEYATTRSSLVVPVPVPAPGAVPSDVVDATARIRAGEVVVVTAAAGGTGHFAVQLAALAGCVVVAVVGGPAKAAAAAALGARHVIDYSREDVAASLQRLFPGGVDVVYEGVGGAVRQALLGCLAPGGRLLQLFWGGTDVELGEGRRVIGQIWPKDLKSLLRCRKRVFELAAAGRLRVMTDQGHERQGVEGVAEAIEYMLRGQHVGKVVIRIAEEERSLFDGGDAEMDDAPNAMAALASAAAVAANAMQQQQRSAPPAAGARSPTASVQFVREIDAAGNIVSNAARRTT